MTRAESHLLFASGKKSNTFLDELPLESSPTEPDLGSVESTTTTQSNHQFTISEPDGPNVYTPHSLMDTSVLEAAPHGRGREFGDQLHSFAEEYALTNDVSPRNSDEQAVKEFLDTCEGELLIEQEVYLPLTIGDERVVISGIADLVHIRPDMVTVVDYKTVVERSRQAEYRKQLSVYWHVVNEIYPNRTVTASIFYTNDASLEEISPLSKADLAQLVSTAQSDSKE
jgi:ATP-dependent exoDNAse (exonuclease V) beta subunit